MSKAAKRAPAVPESRPEIGYLPGKPAPKAAKLGNLPVWNLNDLYPGIDSPELKRDLERADADCAAFEKDFKGRLAELAAAPGAPGLLEAVKRYEMIGDVLGRIGSYSGLLHAGDSTNAAITKFYGDMSERITARSFASAVLRSRTQPHRRRGARRAP